MAINAKKNVKVTAIGDVLADGKSIKLNDGTGNDYVRKHCAFTGSPHMDRSTTVLRGKA